ncbi:hypothetical protein [Nocardioides pantholopis]|nr:hypothetical protein [Nocardioides pantholopis]
MDEMISEARARHQIQERIARASATRLSRVPRRQRVARQLRRMADRLDG